MESQFAVWLADATREFVLRNTTRVPDGVLIPGPEKSLCYIVGQPAHQIDNFSGTMENFSIPDLKEDSMIQGKSTSPQEPVYIQPVAIVEAALNPFTTPYPSDFQKVESYQHSDQSSRNITQFLENPSQHILIAWTVKTASKMVQCLRALVLM